MELYSPVFSLSFGVLPLAAGPHALSGPAESVLGAIQVPLVGPVVPGNITRDDSAAADPPSALRDLAVTPAEMLVPLASEGAVGSAGARARLLGDRDKTPGIEAPALGAQDDPVLLLANAFARVSRSAFAVMVVGRIRFRSVIVGGLCPLPVVVPALGVPQSLLVVVLGVQVLGALSGQRGVPQLKETLPGILIRPVSRPSLYAHC